MNTEQIAQFIDHPELMDDSAIETLGRLAQQYPYSSVYGLLYVSAVSKFQSISLDTALNSTAYRLSDRVRLFQILQDATWKADPVVPTQDISEKDVHIAEDLETTHTIAPILIEACDFSEIQQEVSEKDSTEEEKEPQTLKNDAEILPKTEINFQESTEAYSTEQDYFVALDILETEKINADISERETTIIEDDSTVLEVIETQPTPIIETGPRSFTAWLRSGSDPSDKIQNKEIATLPSDKQSKQSIIDKFIETEPSISRPKSEFYSPSKKAKESLAESTIPVSETLAKIFAAQGNYPKAIHVYHQLILSFPEKKSLFAVQIEELKKKITP